MYISKMVINLNNIKYKNILQIVKQCEKDIEQDIKSLKFIKCIDFIDIFPVSEEHKILLDKEASEISTIIEETERGNFYSLNKPITTKFGSIKIFKIRKFDETRLQWVAAPDFETTEYNEFCELYMNDGRFKYIEKPTYKGLEFKTEKSLVYFLDELTTDYYNI